MQDHSVLRKDAWTSEEDNLLRKGIEKHGEGRWHLIPRAAGLKRCRKSCRLRWLNYLKPDIKRGEFEQDEIDLMLRLHKLLGNRFIWEKMNLDKNDAFRELLRHFHDEADKSTVTLEHKDYKIQSLEVNNNTIPEFWPRNRKVNWAHMVNSEVNPKASHSNSCITLPSTLGEAL